MTLASYLTMGPTSPGRHHRMVITPR